MSKELKSCSVHFQDGEVRNEVRVYDYPMKGDFIDLNFGEGVHRYVKRFEVIQRVFEEIRITPHSISGGVCHIHVKELG